MIRIGYACINTQLPSPNKTIRLANAAPERVIALGRQNLNSLASILQWNQAHGIRLFRLSSDIIPLASHPVIQAQMRQAGIDWTEALAEELEQVGALIRDSGARVSMHPGQYTVINALRPEVVSASLAEIEYHTRLLDALGTDASARIILHLGGVYGDKVESMRRFALNFTRLSISARNRLTLENDEKNYTTADALALSETTGAPVVFDVFHHRWNPSLEDLTLPEIVTRCAETWQSKQGPPKLHYSDQWSGKPPGSHAASIDLVAFGHYYQDVLLPVSRRTSLDLMLEVKDKEQSVLRVYEKFPELGMGEPEIE